jgi:uncharacterized protein (DUF1697 family)
MTRYVAFLRAINVGGHVVKMDALRRLFEEWGGADVATFIASGNVVFDSARRSSTAAERSIEEHLHRALGYPVVTFLRTIPELAAIAAHAPFAAADYGTGATLFIGFMKEAPPAALVRIVAASSDDANSFSICGRELYWLQRRLAPGSAGTGPPLERILGSPITVRNVNTVRRLAARYCS